MKLFALPLVAAPEELRLPTCNDALFNGQPEKFYMYVNRNFEGQATQAWEDKYAQSDAGWFAKVLNHQRDFRARWESAKSYRTELK